MQEVSFARENRVKDREMGLITKLAWVALPALAGCGMLSQVSSQGTGTNPGGKAREMPFFQANGFGPASYGVTSSSQLLAMISGAATGSKVLIWNNQPLSEEDIVVLKPDKNGTVTIEVTTEDGKISPNWTFDSGLSITEPLEAGKAPGLRVSGEDAKTPILVTKPQDQGMITSKKFLITPDMRELNGLKIIGNGEITDTYLSLRVSIDGAPPIDWTRQAPNSNGSFDPIKIDLTKIQERASGKDIVGQLQVVDRSTDKVIGLGGFDVRALNVSTASNSNALKTSFFTHQNIFLGPNNRPFNNFSSLVNDGKKYAAYFGLKTIDSQTNFGMPKEDMYYVLTEVNKLVASPTFDHDPATWKRLPLRLTDAALNLAYEKVADLGHRLEDPKQKADFEYFVKLKSIEEWYATRFRYDDEIAFGRSPRIDFRDAMSSHDPRGVCGDISWGIVYFATAVGLNNVYKIEGANKASNGKDYSFTHSWNGAILPSGAVIFCDPTRKHFTIKLGARERNGLTFSPFGMGIEEWNTGFFLAFYHNQTVIGGVKNSNDVNPSYLTSTSRQFGSKQGSDFFTNQKWSDWYNLNISNSFMNAHTFYQYLFDR